jgi:hypothetical protein
MIKHTTLHSTVTAGTERVEHDAGGAVFGMRQFRMSMKVAVQLLDRRADPVEPLERGSS